MTAEGFHRIARLAELPALTLRVTEGSLACYRTHTHHEYSVGVVDAGEAVFDHPGGPHKVGAGAVVLIEPGVPHSCNPLPGSPWSYRMLFIEANWLHQLMASHIDGAHPPAAMRFHTRCLTAPAATAQVDQLCRAMEPTNGNLTAEHLAQGLCQWLRSVVEPGAPADQPSLPAALAPVWDALLGVAGRPATVQSLARSCSLHPTTFIRRFKAAVGVTPGEFLRDRQVNGARQLIASGVNLAEAAYAMGFADQAHMQRAFKARHAMTPGRFAPGVAQGR
ncbi:MAG TPA: AraC family transcriptional regulator [Hydrogenophaga sp.]|nr:AraC family transcriptional regulator [Hydrogenophaga sp.]